MHQCQQKSKPIASNFRKEPVPIAKSVKCLIEDPEVLSMIPAQSHTFAEIDHEIISTAIYLPSADSRRVVVSYKRKYEDKVLVDLLVKLAKRKCVVN